MAITRDAGQVKIVLARENFVGRTSPAGERQVGRTRERLFGHGRTAEKLGRGQGFWIAGSNARGDGALKADHLTSRCLGLGFIQLTLVHAEHRLRRLFKFIGFERGFGLGVKRRDIACGRGGRGFRRGSSGRGGAGIICGGSGRVCFFRAAQGKRTGE
jgi:hypothetical protein